MSSLSTKISSASANGLANVLSVPQTPPGSRYALILPARNEEKTIRKTLDSIVNQTLRPVALIIALNDCTDGSASIAEEFRRRYDWISVHRHDFSGGRNYAFKALIFAEAYKRLSEMELDFIGNLDADVTLPADYYQLVLQKFAADPGLGIAGGTFYQEKDGRGVAHFDVYTGSVVGMIQLFRMQCYRDIGGYRPVRTGGVDMAADTMARFRGWRTQSFEDIHFLHHRGLGTADASLLRAKYREGVRDYNMGYGFLFHALKCLRRIPERPYLIGSLARMAAYLAGMLGGRPTALSEAEQRFLRAEQRARIRSLFG